MADRLALDLKGWGILVLLSALWGGSFLFVEIGLEELPPISIVAARVSLAALISYVLMKMMSQALPSSFSLWRAFFAMALVNNVIPFLLIVWGQQYILGGVAAILNASTPVFTVIVAQLFTHDEKLTSAKLIGLAVALLGVALVIGWEAVSSFSATNVGQLAILLAGVSYAVASVYGRRFGRDGIAPLTLTTGQLIASSCVLVPLAFLLDPALTDRAVSYRVILALSGLAVVSTSLAYLLYFRLIATAGATNATLVTVLVPVSATLLTWLVLDEQLPSEAFVGMSVIALGLLILDGRPYQWLMTKLAKTRALDTR